MCVSRDFKLKFQQDVDNIPAGYTAVSLIEALNGPPPLPKPRAISPITQDSVDVSTAAANSRNGTLERKKTGTTELEKRGSLKEKRDSLEKRNSIGKDETIKENGAIYKHSTPTLVRSASSKERSCKEKLANRSQSVRDCIKLVNEKTANTITVSFLIAYRDVVTKKII